MRLGNIQLCGNFANRLALGTAGYFDITHGVFSVN